jgi:hypothetical protein
MIGSKHDHRREDYIAPRQTLTPWIPLVPSRPLRPLWPWFALTATFVFVFMIVVML